MSTSLKDRLDVDAYRRDGYTVVHRLLNEHELDEIRAESIELCRKTDYPTHHRLHESVEPRTDEIAKSTHLGDTGSGESDEEVLRRYLCIHFPHKLSIRIRSILAHPRIVDTLVQVIGPNVKAMQSMLFIKTEGKPGQAWHQDEYFIPTRDRSLTAIWTALDDATVENGCLWVLPGSHLPGVIYPERQIDDVRFDCNTEAYRLPYDDDDAVPVEVPAGDAVVFNGYLLHRSLPNVLKRGLRRALAIHYMSANSLLPWRMPREGEHMAMVDDRDIVLVAGEDPYSFKGIEDYRHAHLRPDRDGGCDR